MLHFSEGGLITAGETTLRQSIKIHLEVLGHGTEIRTWVLDSSMPQIQTILFKICVCREFVCNAKF